MAPGRVIVFVWIAWAASWLLSSWWSARTEKRLGIGRELGYRIVLVAGGVLFAVPAHRYEGVMRLWHVGFVGAWACAVAETAGFAFCWWARAHLGKLWSGTITKKADHRVVDTGPYGLVRHPIYTGILLAVVATTIAKGTALGIVGAVLLTAGLYLKARMEEAWLRDELGAEAYDAYRRRVPMLVPFGPKSR
jgi:protein-S-isoprenylcysteine O-methyltransferase Ste14